MSAPAWSWLGRLLDSGRPAAVRCALCELGFSPSDLLAGVAFALGVPRERLGSSDDAALAGRARRRLLAALPVLLGHPDPRLSALGRAWLVAPGVLAELDPVDLEVWLSRDGELAAALAPMLRRKGLALLGAPALRRLAADAPAPARRAAARWVARLRA